jgi:hypothetical protein
MTWLFHHSKGFNVFTPVSENRECYVWQRSGYVAEQWQQSFHQAVAWSLPFVSTPPPEWPIVRLSLHPRQFYKPSISRFCRSLEEVFTTINAFDLKLLSGFNVILTPNLSGKDNLTFCRNRSSHGGLDNVLPESHQ